MVKALPLLGSEPFLLINSDSIWLDGTRGNLQRLAAAFDPAQMDALLLLAPSATSIGYSGRGDFAMAPDGRLRPRAEREVTPFVYAGAAIFSPALFEDAPQGPFSLNRLFDQGGGGRTPVRAAPRRHLDACRHAGGDRTGGTRDSAERGLAVRLAGRPKAECRNPHP